MWHCQEEWINKRGGSRTTEETGQSLGQEIRVNAKRTVTVRGPFRVHSTNPIGHRLVLNHKTPVLPPDRSPRG